MGYNNTFELEGALLAHVGVAGYASVGFEIPGHKYKLRIRGLNGKYRYFYTQEEIDAYYHNKKRDEQAKKEGRSRPTDGRTDFHTTVKKESEPDFDGRSRPDSYSSNMTKVSVSVPSNIREARKQYNTAKGNEWDTHKEYGWINPQGKTMQTALSKDYDKIKTVEATTTVSKNFLDEQKRKRNAKFFKSLEKAI